MAIETQTNNVLVAFDVRNAANLRDMFWRPITQLRMIEGKCMQCHELAVVPTAC